MTEDKDRARRMAEQDARSFGRVSREMFGTQITACSYENMGGWPEGDGERALIPVVIGTRDKLTKDEARNCAAMWREATRRYPKAGFNICLLGYDQDPREVWEFPDAARYVRWWARFAGMDDPEVANRYLGTGSPVLGNMSEIAQAGMGFLAACGCFGEQFKQIALRNWRATPKQ
jgi:hypothetical protein